MIVSLKIQGVEGLMKCLDELPDKLERKGIRNAVKAAGAVILAAVQQNIMRLHPSPKFGKEPLRSRMLSSLTVKSATVKKGIYTSGLVFDNAERYELITYAKGSHTPVAFNVVRKGKVFATSRGREVGRSFIPFALEYGHGRNKQAAARPFMRPALDTAKADAERVLNERLVQELESLVSMYRAGQAVFKD